MNWFETFLELVETTTQPPQQVITEAYTAATISSLTFEDCGDGVFVAHFVNNNRNGIIKFSPNGVKKEGTTHVSVKFFVLQGEIKVNVSGKKTLLKTFSFLEVKPNFRYSMKNTTESDVYLQFARDFKKSTITAVANFCQPKQ